jgi:polyphosphate kinase
VAVLVELQARFDEANNIAWARRMEDFGVHVAYGLPGLKTHAKVALVVRRGADGIRRYVHIGTGNYNSKTARLYTDIGLFTCNARDRRRRDRALQLADRLLDAAGTGSCWPWRRTAATKVLELIERETQKAKAGRARANLGKMNALVDPVIIARCTRLQAGVEIDLLVRGICCLRPACRA